ncbi:pre-mRNA-splicing factor cwc22 [Serendipita sp. 399]|nr:pre-mRNA-splicing factor cwc22 [Serendipita sp. 399]
MQIDGKQPAPKPQPQEAGFDARAEFLKLTANSRSGGVYMPPARLRALQEEAAKDKSSPEYQRLSWDALRKSITGIVNRVNIVNIKAIVPELFNENLIRGKGLFARSIMKAQAASLPFTPVFACLVAIVNTKLPTVGELVLTRLVSQFRRSFKRNDKPVCVATSTFIAHLVNQSVADSSLALQIIILLLEHPTDSSVEIAVGFMKEVGAYLAEFPKENNLLFDRFRAVLHEGAIDKRVQYMIEVLFQVRKDQYKDNPIIQEGLDLVEEDDQITHAISLDDKLEVQESLNVFKFDPDYLQHEQEYNDFKSEVLGNDDSEDEGSGDSEDEEEEAVPDKPGIQDKTETNLVNLRKVIYLTLQNALSYEEAVHKLLKVKIQEGEEIELCNMVIECASQERTYSRYYGLIGERLCKLNRVWYDCFEQAFTTYYETIHRYETNRLRIVAKFFGHLLATDSISWTVFEAIKMNENDTTSASRIFVKIMLQEMNESMGIKALAERFKDPDVRQHCTGLFPTDLPKNTRFSINFFTSVNLGALTVEMREHLTNAQKLLMEQRAQAESSSSDSDSDSSDDSSDSDSDSGSSDSRSQNRSRDRSPPRRRRICGLMRREMELRPTPSERESRAAKMRTSVFSNASLDGQQSSSAHEWPGFELPYDMMFDDSQPDPQSAFGTDDKVDDVHGYPSYLNEDLQVPTTHLGQEEPVETLAAVTIDQPEEIIPESPVSPEDTLPPASKKQAAVVDPYAEAFLQESLGQDKWTTFSARLFERRLTGSRSKSKKTAATTTADGQIETTATVIDFLCKAEAVKEVLRIYVPHPYNPHKTLSHGFEKAPGGRVTLSRSTVLALSGWSNTQFSYWARRSEAIGVLASHDHRLKMVANAFTHRLNGTKILDEVAAVEGVTGKGLDIIIDEVKERTGASPFIHGKHSSLDPFTVIETLPDGTRAEPTTTQWANYDSTNGVNGYHLAYGEGTYNGRDIAPSSLSPTSPTAQSSTSNPKRSRQAGGSRAKQSTGKRKAKTDPDSPRASRKRAKTNVSTTSTNEA